MHSSEGTADAGAPGRRLTVTGRKLVPTPHAVEPRERSDAHTYSPNPSITFDKP